MATPVGQDKDHLSASRILNLPDATSAQEPATLAQVQALVEGLAWKDSVRVRTTANVNLASPGASLDGIALAAGDRFLASAQTTGSQNGIYVWNGAATPATRAQDASTSAELESAVVTVEEGTSAGATFRQTTVNFVLDTGTVTWVAFGTASPAATETTAGIAEVATQSETDTGTDDARMVTPLKLATWSGRMRKFSQTIGDGAATQYDVTHNLNTKDLHVAVYETGGTFRVVDVEVQMLSVNAVRILYKTAPALNAYRVVVLG